MIFIVLRGIKMLKHLYWFSLILILSVFLGSGCAVTANEPAEKPTLTVYARVTDITREVEMKLVEAFETKHTVKVNLVTGEDPDLFAKFVVEKENGLETADVLAGWNPVGTLELQEKGWLKAYVPPALKENIPARFQEPVVIQHVGLVTLAYSPEKLGSVPPPAAFADLVKPEYKGKVEMVDPIISSTSLKFVGHLVYSTPLGWDYWQKLQTNGLRLVGDWGQLPKDLVDPASPAAVVIAGYGRVYPDMQKGQPLKVVIPQEGLIAGEYVVAIAAETKQPELAQAFVEEVIFHPDLLRAWADRYLPVTVAGFAAPEGTPALDEIVISDWKLIQAKELEIKTQWQIIQSQPLAQQNP
jgi:iron(III) transport system substrate-binding protein